MTKTKEMKIREGMAEDKKNIIRRVAAMKCPKAEKHIRVMKMVDASIAKWQERFFNPDWS